MASSSSSLNHGPYVDATPRAGAEESTQPLLTPEQWEKWLLNIGYLRGAILTSRGPITSLHQAAIPKRVDAPYITSSRRELLSDEYAHTESDARYYHAGWLKPGDIPDRPWSILKQSDVDISNTSLWASRHLVSTHFTINMSTHGLDPTEEFVQTISQALAIQSTAGKVKAMQEVFNTWGEVIPLVAEVGISLVATGTVSPGANLPSGPIISRSSGPQDIPWTVDAVLGVKNVFQRRLASHTQGGDPQALRDGGYPSWLQSASTSIPQDTGNLTIVKVVRAVPIINILDEHHQTQIRNLYSTSTLYSYSVSVGTTAGTSFGDLAAGPRAIRSIRVWFAGEHVEGILITYENNVTAGPYGKCQGTGFDDFLVGNGEYITDLFVWADSQRIKGLRFVKNTGQMSSHFGNRVAGCETDPPQMLSNYTSVLAGLTGSYDATGITRLQAVWRNDIELKNRWPTQTSFAGSRHSPVFNDLEYIGDPYTARLSRITLRDGGLGPVVNFQTSYIWNGPSGVVGAETSVRGTQGAGERRASFELDKNEFIVQVKGTHDGCIRQIQFTTNKRTSPLFGETKPFPVAFGHTAPPGMRLYYLVGKSGGCLDSLLFVWAPIPDLSATPFRG